MKNNQASFSTKMSESYNEKVAEKMLCSFSDAFFLQIFKYFLQIKKKKIDRISNLGLNFTDQTLEMSKSHKIYEEL